MNDAVGIVLVGVSHRDPRGYRRLLSILSHLKPRAVLLEVSPFAVRFRLRHRRFLMERLHHGIRTEAKRLGIPLAQALRHPRVQEALLQMALPFEWRSARSHWAMSGTPFFCIDRSEFSRTHIATWPELIARRNISLLLSSETEDLMSRAKRDYSRARLHLSGTFPEVFRPPFEYELKSWEQREAHLERQVRKAAAFFRSGRIVYVGGWWHTGRSRFVRTLRQRIEDLSPGVFLLDQSPISLTPSSPGTPARRHSR